ncbi:hypothetical protein SAMN05216567_109389 [Variovorax sp. OK605]|uniref:DUF2145 domain-containing protein n=1 Tax=Variovorax sp. OK605 TaxID=1855317 RepID=UPI0008E9C9A5|nr:hypothetical protein SAMN05216567_109389 [Variovorax sp. OK605]
MSRQRRLALPGLAAALAFAGCVVHAAASSQFCDRAVPLSASQQDRLLRFTAAVQDALSATGSDAVLISRSGLDLSRFGIRYSHAAIAWKAEGGREGGIWSARQLYYACDEGHPRLYDQGLAGFVMGIDDAALGYVSIVALPPEAAQALRGAALDTPRAVHLLAARYSANAYPFSLRYQNCNQWVMELLAVAWGGLPDGDGLRRRAQQWLRDAPYKPAAVDVGSHALVFASSFVPLLHLDDHPQEDIYALKLRVSLPSAVEAFVRERHPLSERVELCHDGRQIVLHRGWEPVSDGCLPGAGDRVVALD